MQRFLRIIAALCLIIMISLALVNTSAMAKSETRSIKTVSTVDILHNTIVRSFDVSAKSRPSIEIKNASEQGETNNEAEIIEGYVDLSATLPTREVELIALVTMAEAEGECEEGKRLVIDTILNRVDCDDFPDNVTDVIYQPSQFSSMWNGRVDRCYVQDDICQLVREELQNRTDHEVMFFTADHYGAYGDPMFSVGNHYFSSRE